MDRERYLLDLQLLLDEFEEYIYGTGFDILSEHSRKHLEKKLINLWDSHNHYDPELEFLFDSDSLGG